MWNRLINAITWLLVAGSIAIILGGLTGRPVFLASVPTGSMVPALVPGDMIPIVPVFPQEFEPGQVVVFRTEHDRTWIVHRIVSGNARDGYVTKGDANPLPDPYPVFPQDVAGIVPSWNGTVMRVPRLGLLSLERSPLANPMVAGVAMVAGVYLLVTDIGVTWRAGRFRRLKRVRVPKVGSRAAVGLYGGLAVAVFVMTVLTTWSLGSKQAGDYRVVESQSTRVKMRTVLTLGYSRTETSTLRNSSPFPMLVGLDASDADVVIKPNWLVLGPGKQGAVEITVRAASVGDHSVIFRQALYFPFLPLPVIKWAAGINWYAPIFLTALVPPMAVLLIASADTRVSLYVAQVWKKMNLRRSL